MDTPLIALAGQPNMGKSTIFNLLTGLNQHVGNWPGKTVERREGTFTYNERSLRLVDLPGTYSLTANSPEEVIAREFIVREKPAVVVAVVSAANLERSLYLVAELVALDAPLVVALNMMDVSEQEGICVEPKVLEAALGLPVVPMTASRAVGVRELLAVVQGVLDGNRVSSPNLPEVRADHREVLENIEGLIAGRVPEPYPQNWIALKLLEGDVEVSRMMQAGLPLRSLGFCSRCFARARRRVFGGGLRPIRMDRAHGPRCGNEPQDRTGRADGASRPVGGASGLGPADPGRYPWPGVLDNIHIGHSLPSAAR